MDCKPPFRTAVRPRLCLRHLHDTKQLKALFHTTQLEPHAAPTLLLIDPRDAPYKLRVLNEETQVLIRTYGSLGRASS